MESEMPRRRCRSHAGDETHSDVMRWGVNRGVNTDMDSDSDTDSDSDSDSDTLRPRGRWGKHPYHMCVQHGKIWVVIRVFCMRKETYLDRKRFEMPERSQTHSKEPGVLTSHSCYEACARSASVHVHVCASKAKPVNTAGD